MIWLQASFAFPSTAVTSPRSFPASNCSSLSLLHLSKWQHLSSGSPGQTPWQWLWNLASMLSVNPLGLASKYPPESDCFSSPVVPPSAKSGVPPGLLDEHPKWSHTFYSSPTIRTALTTIWYIMYQYVCIFHVLPFLLQYKLLQSREGVVFFVCLLCALYSLLYL